MKKRKQHLTLLEVMIAFMLIVLCVLPLIHPHLFILKSQRAFIQKIDLDHTTNLLYADTVEKLYRNEIPWDMITSKIAIPIQSDLPYEVSFRFKEKHKKSNEKDTYSVHLFELTYQFKKEDQVIEIPYMITIQRDLRRGTVDESE